MNFLKIIQMPHVCVFLKPTIIYLFQRNFSIYYISFVILGQTKDYKIGICVASPQSMQY